MQIGHIGTWPWPTHTNKYCRRSYICSCSISKHDPPRSESTRSWRLRFVGVGVWRYSSRLVESFIRFMTANTMNTVWCIICLFLGIKILINFWMAYFMVIEQRKSKDGRSRSHSLMVYVEWFFWILLLIAATLGWTLGLEPLRFKAAGMMLAAILLSYLHFFIASMISGFSFRKKKA